MSVQFRQEEVTQDDRVKDSLRMLFRSRYLTNCINETQPPGFISIEYIRWQTAESRALRPSAAVRAGQCLAKNVHLVYHGWAGRLIRRGARLPSG